MKALIAAAALTLGTITTVSANPDAPVVQYNVGIYAADAEIKEAWSCESVVRSLEAAMSEELNRDIELDLTVDDNYNAGVMDMTDGSVQFGRFPNIESKWVLNHQITDEVADAWLAALRAVDPESVLGPRDASLDSGCAADKLALAQ